MIHPIIWLAVRLVIIVRVLYTGTYKGLYAAPVYFSRKSIQYLVNMYVYSSYRFLYKYTLQCYTHNS